MNTLHIWKEWNKKERLITIQNDLTSLLLISNCKETCPRMIALSHAVSAQSTFRWCLYVASWHINCNISQSSLSSMYQSPICQILLEKQPCCTLNEVLNLFIVVVATHMECRASMWTLCWSTADRTVVLLSRGKDLEDASTVTYHEALDLHCGLGLSPSSHQVVRYLLTYTAHTF